MPLLIDSTSRTAIIVDAVSRLIADGGITAVTMRAVARESRIPQASLAHHLSDKDRLLAIVAHRFGIGMVEDAISRSWREGIDALLPGCAEGLVQGRIWLTWCDLGRTHEQVGFSVAMVRERQTDLIRHLLKREVSIRAVTEVLAFVDGLLAALTTRIDPISCSAAHEALGRFVDHTRDRERAMRTAVS
jgi:AcrR family transcriptional regulator